MVKVCWPSGTEEIFEFVTLEQTPFVVEEGTVYVGINSLTVCGEKDVYLYPYEILRGRVGFLGRRIVHLPEPKEGEQGS